MNNPIGAALAAAMAKRGLTDARTAELFAVSTPTITRWRTGKIIPPRRQSLALAAFTGLPLDDVDEMIAAAEPARPDDTSGAETLRALILHLEREQGITYTSTGITKSRYYRLRSGGGVLHLADIPAFAARLGVPEERVVMAVYRSALAEREQQFEQSRAREAG